MIESLTAAQMRAIEAREIESGRVTGAGLMEVAGEGVVAAVFAAWPDLAQSPQKAMILSGPGNNGGDGFVVARLLRGWGWEVEVFLYGEPGRLPPDAKLNHDRWAALGPVRLLGFPQVIAEAAQMVQAAADGAALVVDALFGTGLTRALDGLAPVIDAVQDARVVAVDIPSGLCADSGRVIGGHVVRAALTVPFHRAKLGHYLAQGPEICGALDVRDIGLRHTEDHHEVRLAVPDAERLAKEAGAHKFGHGHALVLTGGAGRTGAARLAARAALRVGAGLVTLGVPGAAQMEVASQITALMLTRIDDAAAMAEVLEDVRIGALCLGPGLGLERAEALVPQALGAGRNVVLDADALTVFASQPDALFDRLHDGCVLTPHMGEFARLFPDLAAEISGAVTVGPAPSKVEAVRKAAHRAGATVLLKGADTVIAAPDGRAVLSAACYDQAASWLATAGSGDVLAGLITGLLARGMAPLEAAKNGAWLHAEAGRVLGAGLIAEDLPEALPTVLKSIGI